MSCQKKIFDINLEYMLQSLYISILYFCYMNISELLHQKEEKRDELKVRFDLPRRSKILIAVHFTEKEISRQLLDGFAVLPANFIVFGSDVEQHDGKNICFQKSHESFDMTWIDAILWDCNDIKLEKVMQMGVTPLINDKNYLGSILQEFSPWRGEGNAYLYEKGSMWSAYYALIRYLENHKFPYDNRNLVKNVVWV